MVRHIVDQSDRLQPSAVNDPVLSGWPAANGTAIVSGTSIEPYTSPSMTDAPNGSLFDARARLGGSEEAGETRRRPEDWILDLVEALPFPVKSALPLVGALIAVLLLFHTTTVAWDGQGLLQTGMAAGAGLLAGHIVQCCCVGALLLASRLFAAGPAILKGLLVVGTAAGLMHLFGSPGL